MTWIVLAAIAAAAATGLLTWLLYRLNATTEPKGRRGDAADPIVHDGAANDGAGDGGGD